MRYCSAMLAFMVLLSGVFASFSITGHSVSPTVMEPNQYGTLALAVSNLDTSNSVSSIKIELRTSSHITIRKDIGVGDLGPAGTISFSIPFRVGEGAPTGIYPIDIDIYGSVQSATGGTSVLHKKVITVVQVVNRPAIQISLDSNDLTDISERVLIVKNSGGMAKHAYISLANEGFGFLNQDVIYISMLEEGAAVPITIDARNSPEGSQKMEFTLSYNDELGTSYSEERSLPVSVKKESGEFVFLQKGDIVTGQEGVLKLEVLNEGEDVRNMRFSISDEKMSLIGISEFRIGDIAKGERKIVEVPVLASIEPGTSQIKFLLKWIENRENKEGSKYVPVKVSSDSDVGVYLEAKPTPLYPNTEHTISITVSNLGSYPILATTVEFGSDAFQMLSIQPEQYIGGLSRDDFSSVQYKVRTRDVEAGTYPITVKVKYKDASGEWKVKESVTNIAVSEPVPSEGPDIATVALALIVVGGAAYWFLGRGSQKKK